MSAAGFVGELLIREGVCDAAAVARALDVQSKERVTIGRALAILGLAEESVAAAAIAKALHLEYLEGALPDVGPEVAALMPAEWKKRAVPLGVDGKRLRVAIANPLDDSVLRDIEFRTGKKTVAVVVTESWLERLADRLYVAADYSASYDILRAVNPAGEVEATTDQEYELVDPDTLAKDVELAPIVKLVNHILSNAAKARASDVHIEPHETDLRVRQRVDGLLQDAITIPRRLQDAAISRIKIMSGMDIAERRKPQDGRSKLRFEGQRIDLRVSTMPTQFGEKVVIRLLTPGKTIPAIDQLGFRPNNLRLLQAFLSRPQGMILVTGPTGSGKTTTLYAVLHSIKSPTNNIITLEDPIEIQVPGVNQMQVNVRAGVTFASGLRSVLRQDPNVILVGEIRDRETADIALGAAQTGHVLLSTLHTNDAPATISRLFDLGIQPFLIASSLVGIVAQRLVRQPCPACVAPQQPSAEAIAKIGGMSRLPPGAKWVAGRGCDQCNQSGVKGRIAIHEVLTVNDEVRDLISNRASEQVIRKAARRAGMRTLAEDGIDKAAEGLTTLDEVFRVVSPDDISERVEDPPPADVERRPTVEVDSAAPKTGAAGGRVLVVEDSPTVAEVVKYFLELEGFKVAVAENGLVGLEMALREPPHVIVTDVNMPGMGGVAMVKALRAEPRTSDVRILMLTSESSIESETEGLEAGADDYILKPVEARRLAARVKSLRARSLH
jgi:type IV pilus assembly protein PilB